MNFITYTRDDVLKALRENKCSIAYGQKERENKPKRKWVPPEEYYGESAWESILFFTKGQEAVDKWRKEKAEREVIND